MPPRDGTRSRHHAQPSRAGLIAGALVATAGLILLLLRFVPGSPLVATAAPRGDDASGSSAGSSQAGSGGAAPSPSPSPSPSPLLVQAGPVSVNVAGWWSWALLDQRTNKITGSTNMASTNRTASMIKSWIAADYLRRSAQRDQTPSDARLAEVSTMIRDSDNAAATDLYAVVGKQASTKRLISICGLTDSKPGPTSWSDTRVSARDTTRLADCIDDGRAAGPKWTSWLLNEMRSVRGAGDFGIRKAFPAAVAQTIAIKNGWVTRTDNGDWEVNCLAIGDGWTMGVLTRYDASLGYTYGANACKNVAAQLRV
jgi:hypothetical protein